MDRYINTDHLKSDMSPKTKNIRHNCFTNSAARFQRFTFSAFLQRVRCWCELMIAMDDEMIKAAAMYGMWICNQRVPTEVCESLSGKLTEGGATSKLSRWNLDDKCTRPRNPHRSGSSSVVGRSTSSSASVKPINVPHSSTSVRSSEHTDVWLTTLPC